MRIHIGAAALVIAAIIGLGAAIAGGSGFAAADGDHKHGALQHLRDHIPTAQAAVAEARANAEAVFNRPAVQTALTALNTASEALTTAQRALDTCTRAGNCIASGTSGSQVDARDAAQTSRDTALTSFTTAIDTAAAAFDSDSDGDETWAEFSATRTLAEAALSHAHLAVFRALHADGLRVSDAPSGTYRITLDEVPENRRFHEWSSGSVCINGRLGSLLLID